MLKLRPYQDAAVAATYKYFEENQDAGLIVLPTGTGKSLIVAEICKLTKEYPQTRIIVATHTREIIAQNFQKLIHIWPDAPAGIHSAGLNRKDLHHKILFVSIQSVYKKAFLLQRCDVLIVDEAHSIGRDAETMWGKFIADLKVINPHMRVIGLSATPYRLDSGNLIDGETSLFKNIIFEYAILDAIKEGYLCEVVPKSMATKLNVLGVHKRGGEFIESELQAAVNVDSITKAAVDELFQYGHDRKTWLIFGSGVDHARAIATEITSRGVECAVITGETPKTERDNILRRFKDGTLRAVSNNKVLTVGLDVPRIDLIADLNPTQSAGLFVQKIGRGMRLHAEKENTLLLDYANNLPRHGCIDQIKAKAPSEGDGVAPIKDCPGKLPDGTICCTILHAAAMTCHICGFEFPEPELKIEAVATSHAVLSTQIQRKYRRVMSVSYKLHEKKGGTPSLRVSYMTEGFQQISEWICLQHNGFAREKAEKWWKRRAQEDKILSGLPIPRNIEECLGLVKALKTPSEIVTMQEGKYDSIVGYKFTDGESAPATVVREEAPTTYLQRMESNELLMEAEDIPF